ncbi:MAG: GIY-YIG nuclease family protein [Deltaproteobacteria bacterium]|nr:GIY-YIG nuclease family protein [Deltaproteobacteria bacterium]
MANHSIPLSKQQGTYALVFKCGTPFRAVAGRLGPISLTTGYWVYVGSAFGPGGLHSRLAHHLKPSTRPHWHLDYIKHALHPIEIWVTADEVKREHDWAGKISTLKGATRPIEGFGASDCQCLSHLIHLPRRPDYSQFLKQTEKIKPADSAFFRLVLDK